MFSIASGSAASELAVVKAISQGSLTQRQKRPIGIRARSATGISASRTNTTSAP